MYETMILNFECLLFSFFFLLKDFFIIKLTQYYIQSINKITKIGVGSEYKI